MFRNDGWLIRNNRSSWSVGLRASHATKPHTQDPVSIHVALLYLLPLANG